MTDCYIPFLSEEERIYLNTTASYSQARRMSNISSSTLERNSTESNHSNYRNNSISSLWKRRASSESYESYTSEDKYQYPSAKAKELDSLIFDQPQRTMRLSLTPRCAI
ncbi:hypothetical protein K501DRAFT_332451 [Backusella circina FSU 941]|nr:hypothetical protein K501DRAFT_332451 [Backusella circina FSU 941]